MKALLPASQSAWSGAVFLMATSAIGPGFLTQTALFTGKLGASFGFVILISILLDVCIQLNIWRILTVTGMRAQDLANRVLPGAGNILTIMVVLGGLVFNIGNIAGAGLGLEVLTGWDTRIGGLISAMVALLLFVAPGSLAKMDGMARLLGLAMLGLTLYVVFSSGPPLGEAVHRTFLPEKIDLIAILTLVGGTVGGYISFAGAHRLIDAGITGQEHLRHVSRSATMAILLASVMRILLFLAALGVVAKGMELSAHNPAASMFQFAAGPRGYFIFGFVMWCAAITSIIGVTYTSISFLRSILPEKSNSGNLRISIFLFISTIIYLFRGQPVQTLVLAGLINAFILPLALGLLLRGIHRTELTGDYRHPRWLTGAGILALAATLGFSIWSVWEKLS